MKYPVVKFFCCFLLLISTVDALATHEKDGVLFRKNFPLLYLLEFPMVRLNKGSQSLEAIRRRFERDAHDVIKSCKTTDCHSSTLQFTDAEITSIGDELAHLVLTDVTLRKIIRNIKLDGVYPLYTREADTIYIRKAWQTEARGINYILGTYIDGRAPLYPKIDSISFRKDDPIFRDSISASVSRLLDKRSNKNTTFFTIPLKLALEALRLNGRDEAVRYEPIFQNHNDAAYHYVRKVKWDSYPYSVILVPGLGPEKPEVKLDPNGAKRCDSAAVRYRAGKAPFIVVSGGHVHPYKTPYCEALEMKKYMIEVLHIPAAAIIIEPHARHTTTNLRNTNRLIYSFKIPAGKPVMIVTDTFQNNYINGNMRDKVVKELGYTPFSSMKKISATETEYLPSENSNQVNSMDPLDP